MRPTSITLTIPEFTLMISVILSILIEEFAVQWHYLIIS